MQLSGSPFSNIGWHAASRRSRIVFGGIKYLLFFCLFAGIFCIDKLLSSIVPISKGVLESRPESGAGILFIIQSHKRYRAIAGDLRQDSIPLFNRFQVRFDSSKLNKVA